jgi:hypothetical protein
MAGWPLRLLPRVRVMQKEKIDSSMKMTVSAYRVSAVSMHHVRRLSFVVSVLRDAACLLSAFVVNPAACNTFHKVWMHGGVSSSVTSSASWMFCSRSVVGGLQIGDETLHCITDDWCVVAALVLLVHLARLLVASDELADGVRIQVQVASDVGRRVVREVQVDDMLMRIIAVLLIGALARRGCVDCGGCRLRHGGVAEIKSCCARIGSRQLVVKTSIRALAGRRSGADCSSAAMVEKAVGSDAVEWRSQIVWLETPLMI